MSVYRLAVTIRRTGLGGNGIDWLVLYHRVKTAPANVSSIVGEKKKLGG